MEVDILSISITIFSVVASAFSIALAIFAIWQANSARIETQKNSERVNLVLKDIESDSNSIREDVSKNMKDMQNNIVGTQKSLMEMQKNMNKVFTERVMADIPQKIPPGEEFIMGLTSTVFKEHPELLADFLKESMKNQAKTSNEQSSINDLQEKSQENDKNE